jgi:membrane protease YdiL (CAAX protease family)
MAQEIEPRKMMEPMDDHLPITPEEHQDKSPSRSAAEGGASIAPSVAGNCELLEPVPPLAGDPISYAAAAGPASAQYTPPPAVRLPSDLSVSWSWPHLLVFLFAGAASMFVVPAVLALVISVYIHKSQHQMQEMFTNPGFLVATQVLWFAVIFLFLYVTLGVLRDAPFWWTLGWRRLSRHVGAATYKPWMFFATGSGLAIFVALASSRVKNADKAPIEELFKDRHAALLLMAMAVLIAPLVEETVFRGYLYPLFAAKLSNLAAKFGMDSPHAVRFGTASGILITGMLFGAAHGSQLGWNWGLVSLLTLVGVIFTFARAATGTVLASFLMHLGYNSLIALTSILATKGFQNMPPGH